VDTLDFFLRRAAVAAAVLGIATVALPLLHDGFPSGHDMSAHVTYTYLFDLALKQQQFPVRWIEWVRDGHSQPLFNFYQPGLYYLIEAMHLVVPALSLSLKLTIAGLWWLGAAFMFLLCRRGGGALPGVTAAVVFALSPYLILDVFVRAAYPELAAIACAPGVLWAIDGFTSTARSRYLVALATLTGVMLICHLPSCLILIPLFATYAACSVRKAGNKMRDAVWLVAAAGAGLGMAAFYVWPALAERHLIQMIALTRDSFDFHRHFVSPAQWLRSTWGYGASVPGPNDGMSFQIGIVSCVVIIAAIVRVAARGGGPKRSASASALILWLSIIAFAMFMMTVASVRVWEIVTPLAVLQYPWRFLMLITIASGILAARLVASIGNTRAQAMIVLGVVCAQVLLAHDKLAPARYVPTELMNIDKPGWRYTTHATELGFIEAGYNPSTVTRLPANDLVVGRWAIVEGRGTVKELSMKDDRVALEVDAESELQLSINSHVFPGWTVRIDGGETAFATQPEYGYIRVQIPAGRHRVEAAFTNTSVRTRANLVSVMSLAGIVAFAGYRYRVTRLLHG
jgi:uncharacterized membrane protein